MPPGMGELRKLVILMNQSLEQEKTFEWDIINIISTTNPGMADVFW